MYEFPEEITWEEIFMECAQRIGYSVEIYVNIFKGIYKWPNPDN